MPFISDYHHALLKWYDTFQRSLPWRVNSNFTPNPYSVWISEIMLQQTTVQTVKEYYIRFLKKWPTLEDLAQASLDEVFHVWQGLGYYSRPRNMHRCAKILQQNFNGKFPSTEKELLTLPGIGPYTAAAILAIAFNKPAIVVDGNIERIMARFFQINTPLPKAKKEIKEKAGTLQSFDRPGDYAQALMDLGATICTPKNPKCHECPINSFCQSAEKNPELYPKFLPKPQKPIRYATFFWVQNDKGEVLIERRPDSGLLAGLMGFPSSSWDESPSSGERHPKIKIENIQKLDRVVRHTFTHFHLIGQIIVIKSTEKKGLWVSPHSLKDYALPTLMRKIEKLVQEARQ